MANPTLGQAVSLQYELPRDGFAVQEIQRRRKEEDMALDAARKAQTKALEDIEKYKSNIDRISAEATGVLPPYQQDIKAKTDKLFTRMKEVRAENPNADLRDYTKEELYDLQEAVNRHKLSTESFLKDRQKGVSAPELFEFDSEMDKVAQTGTYAEWVDMLSKKGGAQGSDFYTFGYIKPKEQVRKDDWRKSLFNYSNQAGKVRTEEGAEFTPDSSKKKLFEGWRKTPDYAAAVAEYGSVMPIEKVDQMIYENDWLPLFSYSAAKKKEEGVDETLLTPEDIRKDVPVNIMVAETTKDTPKKVEDVAKYSLTLPSNVSLNIPATRNVMDLKTGKQLDYTGQLSVQGGQILSRRIKDTSTGKTKYVPVLSATASILDKTGASQKVDVAIPLNEIKGQKILEKHKGAIDEIERLTNDLNKEAPAKKGGFTKFTVSGKTYNIPNDRVGEFKKDMGIQ